MPAYKNDRHVILRLDGPTLEWWELVVIGWSEASFDSFLCSDDDESLLATVIIGYSRALRNDLATEGRDGSQGQTLIHWMVR